MITPEIIQKGYSYKEYREMINELLAQNKTTGENHSEEYINYTKLNVQRMDRIDKTMQTDADAANHILSLNKPSMWLVITEAWCGDAAQICPVIGRLAALNSFIELKFILRDEHTDIMNMFLTNGGKAIPVLIFIDAHSLAVLGHWGPRPQAAQNLVLEHKRNPQEPYSEFVKKLHLWYAQDKTLSIQKEISEKVSVLPITH